MSVQIEEIIPTKPETMKWSKFTTIWRLFAIISTILIIFGILLICKAYIKLVLLWLEYQDKVLVACIVTSLFIVVSLPIGIGYIVLVGAEGYLFGIIKGLILTIIGANVGLFIANNILKLIGHHRSINRLIQNDMAQAIMKVISGPLCFKIVLCSRLTPIPFGLQNAIFALSNVNRKVYHLASFLGLIPAQFVGVYVGSTLRSMQDVLDNKNISPATYLFITIQLIFAACLMVWISTKARKQLIKALSEAETTPNKSSFLVV